MGQRSPIRFPQVGVEMEASESNVGEGELRKSAKGISKVASERGSSIWPEQSNDCHGADPSYSAKVGDSGFERRVVGCRTERRSLAPRSRSPRS